MNDADRKIVRNNYIDESINSELERLRRERDMLREILAYASLPLEVLRHQIPFFRAWPLGRKIKAISPDLEDTILVATNKIRSYYGFENHEENISEKESS